MLRVGLPVDVEGELQERAEALFARLQCLLGAFVIRNVHHRSTRPSVPLSRPTPPHLLCGRSECQAGFWTQAATEPNRGRKTSGTSSSSSADRAAPGLSRSGASARPT
jgi:hypothetical protein